jgi:hypothetical protein
VSTLSVENNRARCVATPKAEKPKRDEKPKRKLSVRQHAAMRLGEIVRLRHWRKKYRTESDLNKWLFVVCHTLAPLKERKGGLDLYHLHDFLKHCPLSFDDDDAVKMIHKACEYRAEHPNFRNLSSETVGECLDVTSEERRGCRITQMAAVDETPEQRNALRREKDRQRKQHERRAKSVMPRAEYEAESLSRSKPWKALKMSRAKYYRLGLHKRETSVSATYLESISTVDTPVSLGERKRRKPCHSTIGARISSTKTPVSRSLPEGWPYCAHHVVPSAGHSQPNYPTHPGRKY